MKKILETIGLISGVVLFIFALFGFWCITP